MSATRMLVLGVILLAGGAHGYQVRTKLVSWRADEWARIKPGSIYHAIRKAAADKLIDELHAEPGAAGPERTVYRITEAGMVELKRLVREGLRHTRDPWMLNAAITMLPVLSHAEAAAMIRERILRLEADLVNLRQWRAEPGPDTPLHVIDQANLWLGQVAADAAWAAELLSKIESGAYELGQYSTLTSACD
ncbi:Transcriptional regulator, PadR family [Alloactinosynnema sp. L-07]|uniref:PadR family transcriptional regulator n=1 Tax=Alloactinosynnema sp. L-07 TaxID=1653480 RepID=UPI00065F08BB|nr:PadR family transcriptional regulator [Alloactinosynnema sp. L-07]CRK61480.1 Transcriptional regulator, PadR family [Alloactinosynnema sp. L-07]